MDHTPAERIEWKPAPQEHFTGKVLMGPLSHDPDALNALGVHFDPAARTDWHSHPAGQVLYIVSGAGRVGTEAGEIVDVSAGDVVYAPAGEMHWHGAGPHSPMMHLSLTTGGDTEWTPRKVTDEEYGYPGS
jgi:quercetin dioxygenase-like cupin family protein